MSRDKFKALVHFVVHECRDNPVRLGSVRLNKVLWFVDMLAYQANGVSITGEKYVKRERGSVPMRILATLRELQADQAILAGSGARVLSSTQENLYRLYNRTASLLSDAERGLARVMLNFVCERTANRS